MRGLRYEAGREVPLLHVTPLEETGLVTAAFTTRHGGVSGGECATLNLSFKRQDDPEAVRENYRRLCRELAIAPEQLALSSQVHGDGVLQPGPADLGLPQNHAGIHREGDSWICQEAGVALIRHHADCTPVYLLDPVRKAIGLAHAGWRGTVAGIAGKTVRAMQAAYHTRPQDVLAVIGPSIGPCCFEVTENVSEPMEAAFPDQGLVQRRAGKLYADLWRCNALSLTAAGVLPAHITVSEVCTACRDDWFFSHRREKGKTGTMASILFLRS